MKISDLLRGLGDVNALVDVSIKGLENDSRRVKPGEAFIAYPGSIADGRLYISDALAKGAGAIIYDPLNFTPRQETLSTGVLHVPLAQLEHHLASLASRYYGAALQQLTIRGVTGTNGKTTIAYQLAQAYQLLGKKSAYIGTLGKGAPDALEPTANTTPDALYLHRLFHEYAQLGVTEVCMEVSSHALAMGRVDAIPFQQALFTNLTLDHLDYHKTMDAYAKAKAKLFETKGLKAAILNQDDPATFLMQEALEPSCRRVFYGLSEGADVRAINFTMDKHGSLVDVVSSHGKHTLKLSSVGQFNLYNSLAIFSSLLASEEASVAEIAELMSALRPAPGRMEQVCQSPSVFVDYAHTPDALANVLQTLAALKQGELWVVFGCGGDRDRSKRPMMGNVAAQFADRLIVTSDNPRTEDPAAIAQEITQGIPPSKAYDVILDRREAIAHAFMQAKKKDIILVAGKGHENYQIIGEVKHPFSDQAVVAELSMP